MEEIKPCPFCGSKKVDICRTNPDACWVRCHKCDTDAPSFKTREEAIQFWNTRTPQEGFAEIVFDDEKNKP